MKETTLRQVQEYINRDPSILGDLFKLVSDNWNLMVEAQRKERSSQHLFALGEMLDNLWAIAIHKKKNPRLFSNVECCTILEAIDAVDPDCIGGSPARKELLLHVAKSMKALGWHPDDDFITKIRKKRNLLNNLYKNFGEIK